MINSEGKNSYFSEFHCKLNLGNAGGNFPTNTVTSWIANLVSIPNRKKIFAIQPLKHENYWTDKYPLFINEHVSLRQMCKWEITKIFHV